jgi:glycosyltransferase involved in cell wall biosynthesis
VSKICLVGHFTDRPDEGVRNLAYCLGRELAKRHPVLTLSITDPLLWKKVWAFHPDIIHHVTSPTTKGLALATLISWLNPAAKTLVSAPHPAGIFWGPWMIMMKPRLTLVQSILSEKKFQDWGYRTQFLPNGVDIRKFFPVTAEQKIQLRQKYQVPPDKFIILHIASLKRGRNLEVLKTLQSDKRNQVLIIGRTNERRDEVLRLEQEQARCLVRTEYFSNIEEIYALADCYVFPTLDSRYCVETPLSVLEAMSCNLPVITTPFGALPRLFEEGDGFIFARQESDFFSALESIKKSINPVQTREKVLPYSWEKIIKDLEQIYEQITV